MMGAMTRLPTVTPICVEDLKTRPGASSGLWLVLLVPLACSPGLYTAYAHCRPIPQLLALLALQVGVSGIHLFQRVCISGKKQENNDKNEVSSCVRSLPVILRFASHPYTPALVTAAAISLLTDINPLVALVVTTLCSWLLYELTQWLFTTFPGNFSVGEGALLGQSAALGITYSLYNIISTILQQGKLNETEEISIFIQLAGLVFSSLLFGVYKFPALHAPRMFFPYVCACSVIGVSLSSLYMGQWVPEWLLSVITASSTRVVLLVWWSGLSLLAVAITTWARRKSKLATTVLRKVYHVLIVAVFTPGVLLEPAFTHLASAAALMLCFLLEVVRVRNLEPMSSVISSAFAVFLDEKDEGVLVLSHIYLLSGVAAPLWLTPCPLDGVSNKAGTLLPLLAGVLAVGVGDTAASVGGTYVGRRYWSGTKKTVEGSICGVVAQLVVVAILVSVDLVQVSVGAWGRLLLSTSLVAVVEALTDQVDNIVLPLLLYTPLMDL